jgi:hypothetical protein
LSNEVLGIRPTGAGFSTVSIEPEPAGLKTIEGSVPTPRGILHVRAGGGTIGLDLPPGLHATVLIRASSTARLEVNGAPVQSTGARAARYRSIRIDHAGQYAISVK